MDVPSWHPANEDASLARRLLAASATTQQRTEFKLMPGSTPDTSTDAGRELLSELTRGADGGSAAVEGRGFFDSSDRMYLQEQKRLEAEKLEEKRKQDLEELQKFRSTALKVQAQKAAALVAAATDVQLETAKKVASTSASSAAKIVIKTKKRSVKDVDGATQSKPTKQRKASDTKPTTTTTKTTTTTTKATGSLLLEGYSSSESEDESDAEASRGKA